MDTQDLHTMSLLRKFENWEVTIVRWFAPYVSLYLERDVLELYQLRDSDGFRRLLKLPAHRSANLLRKSELATESGLSIKTVNRYLNLLSMVFQVYPLPPSIPAWEL